MPVLNYKSYKIFESLGLLSRYSGSGERTKGKTVNGSIIFNRTAIYGKRGEISTNRKKTAGDEFAVFTSAAGEHEVRQRYVLFRATRISVVAWALMSCTVL
jgi:hypothetical protein